MRRVRIITGIGKQFVALTVRLLVIKRLIVGKRLGKIEDMNPSVHILMNQADELEIPGRREGQPPDCYRPPPKRKPRTAAA